MIFKSVNTANGVKKVNESNCMTMFRLESFSLFATSEMVDP